MIDIAIEELAEFRVGRLADRHTLMEGPPIDFVGRLQIGCQQAVLPLQGLDHPLISSRVFMM